MADEQVMIRYTDILRESEKAVLFDFAGEELWLPKSQIEIKKDESVVWVAKWLADKNGLEDAEG